MAPLVSESAQGRILTYGNEAATKAMREPCDFRGVLHRLYPLIRFLWRRGGPGTYRLSTWHHDQ